MLDPIKTIAKFLPTYITSMVALVTGPKTYIGEHNRTNEDLQDALLFAGLSACIALFLTPQVLLPNNDDFIRSLGTRLVIGLVVAVLGAAIVAGGCRLVGGEAPFMRLLLTYLYISSGVAIILSVGMFLSFGIALAVDAEAIKQWVQLSREVAPFNVRSDQMEKLAALRSSPAMIVFNVGNMISGILLFAWLITCWGSVRQVSNLSRAKSAVAFVLVFVVACPIFGFALALAMRSIGLA